MTTRTIRRLITGAAATACAAATPSVVPVPASAFPGEIGNVYPERASSTHSLGGFWIPYVEPCSAADDWVGAEVRAIVTDTAGTVVARRSVANGSEPWASEVRLKPGTYRVTTTSICPDKTRSKTQSVKITVKTDRTTVSAGEWKKIKKGMTKAKVRRIVGTLGDQWADLSFIERTSYERYAMIDWTKSGKVQRKVWNAPRD